MTQQQRHDDEASPFVDDDLESQALGPRDPDGAWKILIVDDEKEIHDVTELALRGMVFSDRKLTFLSAHSAREARTMLPAHPDVALILLDVVMETDDAGLRLVRHIRQALGNGLVRVVLRTGQPGQAPETTVIHDYDISDYRTKTELTTTRLFTTVLAALRSYQQLHEVEAQRAQLAQLYIEQKQANEVICQLKLELERERDYLREEIAESRHSETIIGSSPAFQHVMAQVASVATSDATVLVLGESGVGKELIARELHARSPRRAGPLVKVNCASVPRELFESEFFGHVKGSFTGAHKDRVGRFALADRGTLFLDEVGEIPLELQSKLLRALQEREFERVGDTRPQRVDVRVVAATNRDLKAEVEAGRFRADLFYRLNVFPIEVPRLRQRREDIVPLFEHVMARVCRTHARPFLKLTPAQVQQIEAYPWPGNVRELENVVERAVILSRENVLRLDLALPELGATVDALNAPTPAPAPRARDGRPFMTAAEVAQLERENIIAALRHADWKVAGEGGAAELLGMKPSTLAYQMRTLGIERPR